MIWSASSSPILSCASFVAAPIWGLNDIFEFIKVLIDGLGSFSNVSSPANLIFPESIKSIRDSSFITPPLAALTMPTHLSFC